MSKKPDIVYMQQLDTLNSLYQEKRIQKEVFIQYQYNIVGKLLSTIEENYDNKEDNSLNTTELKPTQVFISYSHDSDEHAAHVREFAQNLREIGIDAIIDQYTPVPTEGWPMWMEKNLDQADFILMICTETYHRRVMQREKPGKGKGVQWEGTLIYNRLYHHSSQGHQFLPILFEEDQTEYIPLPIQGHTHFVIKQFQLSDNRFDALYRHLTGQPITPKPQLGTLKLRPPCNQPPTWP